MTPVGLIVMRFPVRMRRTSQNDIVPSVFVDRRVIELSSLICYVLIIMQIA